MKLYLAGPITNTPDHRAHFERARTVVVNAGHEAVCPLDIYSGEDWHEALRLELPILIGCDGICLLPGWAFSRGVRLELAIAIDFKKRIFVAVDNLLLDLTDPRHG